MTDPFLEQCGGWTPAPDILARKYGFETAYTWGKIRRLCQLGEGAYTASHEAIAERIGMSRRTLIEILKVLIRDGYVEDLTPGVRNKAHTYSVKKGEAKILAGMQISHTDIETIPQDNELGTDMGMRILPSDDAEFAQSDDTGMQDLHTSYAENAQPGMQNLHLKRDSSLKTPNGVGKKPTEVQPESNRQGPRWQLRNEFVSLSGIPWPDNKADSDYWWSRIGALYEIALRDVDVGKRLIRDSIDKLRKEELTISDPGSLVKIARSLQAKPKIKVTAL